MTDHSSGLAEELYEPDGVLVAHRKGQGTGCLRIEEHVLQFARDRGCERHLVLKSPHPSPLSASRGFFGNHHFSRANAYLAQHGIEPVDW